MIDSFLYYPDAELVGTPNDIGWDYEEHWIETADGQRLHAWHIGSKVHDHTILFFHGNAGNISHRLHRLHCWNEFPARFFYVDYRGYGLSTGQPTETALYEDARATLNYLQHQLHQPLTAISLFGESLGGAVAIELAQHHVVAHLMLEATFTSLQELVGTLFPFVPTGIVKHCYPSLDRISKVNCPVHIAHGDQDEIVPFAMGRQLATAADAEFYPIAGAHHNDLYLVGGAAYRDQLVQFMNRNGPS